MVVAMMAFIVALAAQQFGYQSLQATPRLLARVGLVSVAGGTVAMSGIYIAAGFTTWAPPPWLTSHHGVNGIASDDVVTGIFVMGGGLVVLSAYALVGAGKLASLRRRPVRLAALWSWTLSFATVVVAGYAIELDTTHFGAGDPKAPGAANDAVYTWIHQDVGLFLFPTLALVMLAAERYVASRGRGVIGSATLAGTTLAFAGLLVFVFLDTARRGAGYVLSTIGLAIIGAALLATLWYSNLAASPVDSEPREAPPELPPTTA
jgi:quinol-cytochrome oxidoreductase complex cytochrome b subunit